MLGDEDSPPTWSDADPIHLKNGSMLKEGGLEVTNYEVGAAGSDR